MPRHQHGTSDPFAVHCPTCGVNPEQRCVNAEGESREPHAERVQLAFALVHEGDFAGSEAARMYRHLFPDVDARRITCAPSRQQFRWRMRWSKVLLHWWATEDEAEKAYGAEYGCDCASFGDDETPMPEALEEQLALGPGEPPENLLDAITQAQQHERVNRKRR
jgi:hypothetical protein